MEDQSVKKYQLNILLMLENKKRWQYCHVERSDTMDKQWKVCVQINPKYDGEYYVYIFNAQTGDELRTLFYKNNNWQGLTDDETVIAWKEKDLKKM